MVGSSAPCAWIRTQDGKPCQALLAGLQQPIALLGGVVPGQEKARAAFADRGTDHFALQHCRAGLHGHIRGPRQAHGSKPAHDALQDELESQLQVSVVASPRVSGGHGRQRVVGRSGVELSGLVDGGAGSICQHPSAPGGWDAGTSPSNNTTEGSRQFHDALGLYCFPLGCWSV